MNNNQYIRIMISIAIADDHTLFRNGLTSLISSIADYSVVAEGANGKELVDAIKDKQVDIAVLDVNMPVMDGPATAALLKKHSPDIKILALSMMDDENSVMRMIRAGARGYLLKDASTIELQSAINNMMKFGYHINELADGRLFARISHDRDAANTHDTFINPREQELLRWVVTEKTYKEIAAEMNASPRTIDGYRESLFEKLQLKSRVGLAMYAIKNGYAKLA